jgi:quercetin dioxygenase-like cupin family protein
MLPRLLFDEQGVDVGLGVERKISTDPRSINPKENEIIAVSGPTVRAATCLSLSVMTMALVTTTAPDAAATAPIGVSATVLSKQTTGDKDYIVSDITIAPGGSTGWHTHRGAIYGIVKAGELTHYSADCRQDGFYRTGEPITDPTGPDHVHIGRNLGPTPVILEVTYIDPAGAPTSDSVPNPGCGFE